MKILIRAVAIFIAVLISAVSWGAECPEFLGSWPYGPTSVADGEGDLLVYGTGTALRISDVSNREDPTVLGEIRLGHTITALSIKGDLTVVSTAPRGFFLVDISDPPSPGVIASIPDIGFARDIIIRGTTAWLAGFGSDLTAVDISNPERPSILSTTREGLSSPENIAFLDSRDTIVITDYYMGFVTYDVTDPTAPILLAVINDMGMRGLAVRGQDAYVTPKDRDGSVRVFDCSDPSNPQSTDLIDTGLQKMDDLIFIGDDLLVSGEPASGSAGLVVFELQADNEPKLVGSLEGVRGRISLEGNTLYTVSANSGLGIVDVSEPSEPAILALIEANGESRRVALAGSFAVIPSGSDILVLDVSEHANPREVWRYRPSDVPYDVKGRGGLAYVAALSEFLILDPSAEPDSSLIGSTELSKQGTLLSLGDGVAAVAAYYTRAVLLIDISNPAAPQEIARIDYDFRPGALVVAGDIVFVIEPGVGVHVVDISDPASPVDVKTIPDDRIGSSVIAHSGNLLFLQNRDVGLRILDAKDPFNPVELSTWSEVMYYNGIGASGDLLAVAGIYKGTYAVDISDPTAPVILGHHDLAGQAEAGIDLQGNIMAVAENKAGVEFFNLGNCGIQEVTAAFYVNPESPEAGREAQLFDVSTGPVEAWAWDFGDGENSSESNPTHTWASTGNYRVTLRVEGSGNTDVAATDLVVIPADSGGPPINNPGSYAWVIPAAAHVDGANGTAWVTDVILHNPGNSDALAYLYLMPANREGSGVSGRPVELGTGVSLLLEDVVDSVFGLNDAGGAILVGSETLLLVNSRTYNQTLEGTYGQFVPGIPVDEAVLSGESVRLLQLEESESFRSNVGVANISDTTIDIEVRLFAQSGSETTSRTFSLPPYSWHQENAISGSDEGRRSATVVSSSPGARYFTYASVVDNRTGDPSLVLRSVKANSLVIGASARVGGYEGTDWRTDLDLFNPGTESLDIRVELLVSDRNNSEPVSVGQSLGPGWLVRIDDVLSTYFHTTGTGALRLSTTGGLMQAASRTYNVVDSGSYGQFVPAVAGNQSLSVENGGRIIGLSQSANEDSGFRTNLGLLNMKASQLDMTVFLYTGDSTALGRLELTLDAYEHRQINRIFRQLSSETVENGFVVLAIRDPEGQFLAYASVVDNRTGDPIYVPAQ